MKGRDNLKCKILSQQWLILPLIILLISTLTALKDLRFLMPNNVMNIFEQITALGLAAAGTTILTISGNSDISAGVIVRLSSYPMAVMMSAGIFIPVVVAAGILIVMFCMFFNRVLAILLKVPSFTVLLVTTGVYTGAVLYLTRGVTQTMYGKSDTVSRFRLPGTVPLVSIINLMGCVVVGIILRCTQTGWRIFVIDSNKKVASLLGIKVTRSKFTFFAMNGFFVGSTTVLLLSRVGSTLPSIGVGYEFQAMDAVVIGGAPISDGKGNIVETSFGVLFMGLISSALNISGVNSYLQEIASGVPIIISLGISAIRIRTLIKNQGGS